MTMIESFADLTNWVDANPNHPLHNKIKDELILCHCLKRQMCDHMGQMERKLNSLHEHYREEMVNMLRADYGDHPLEDLIILHIAKELKADGNPEEIARLGMCTHDYELYTGIRLSIDFVNYLLAYKKEVSLG